MAIFSACADTLAVGEFFGLSALEDVIDVSARAAALGEERGDPAAAGGTRREAASADVAAAGQRTASIMSMSSAENTKPCRTARPLWSTYLLFLVPALCSRTVPTGQCNMQF